MLKKVKGVLVALPASVMVSGLALAQDAGFADAVAPTITAAKTDVTTICVAVLGVLVLIATFFYVKKALGK